MPAATHILVADEDRSVRKLAKVILESAGYQVTEVSDGASALAAIFAEGAEFAILVSGCQMARLKGPELLAQLRAAGNDVPVLLTSGRESLSSIPGLAKDQRAAFLAKPYQADALIGVVSELLNTTAQDQLPFYAKS